MKIFVQDTDYVREESGCWIWQHTKDANGYGVVTSSALLRERVERMAHRALFRQYCPDIDIAGLHLHHQETCNHACVNPEHLTPLSKSRHGAHHNPGNLTLDERDKIRELRGTLTQKEIGRMFGVSQAYVSEIQRGCIWTEDEKAAKEKPERTVKTTQRCRKCFQYLPKTAFDRYIDPRGNSKGWYPDCKQCRTPRNT